MKVFFTNEEKQATSYAAVAFLIHATLAVLIGSLG